MFFMTGASLDYLRKSGGFEVDSAPSLVVVDTGIPKSLTTTTLKKGIYVFFFSQKGLMGGLGAAGNEDHPVHTKRVDDNREWTRIDANRN
jgi:hypothetical protein